MTKITRRGFTAIAGASALAAPGILRASRADAPMRVGFVYVGPIGDFGWSYQHDIGRKQAQAALGGEIMTSYVESVPEAPESAAVFENMVGSGHKLIFATSFGYMDYIAKVAARHPDVCFEQCAGYKLAKNVATYDLLYYQGRYVQGVIAGHLSKSGIIGYVGAIPIPETVQGINAFALGAQSVDPKARVKFILIDSWYDPAKEGDAAKVLIDQGCDVLTQHTDSPSPLQVAASRNISAFGEATDMISFAPKAQLSADVYEWGGYYTRRIKAKLGGTWSSGANLGGFHDGTLAMAPFRNMPEAVAAAARDTVAAIAAGKQQIFTGPLQDQQGKTFLSAGQTMNYATLSGMETLVDGVEGKLS